MDHNAAPNTLILSKKSTPLTHLERCLFVSRGSFGARWVGPCRVAGLGVVFVVGSGVTDPKSRLQGAMLVTLDVSVVPTCPPEPAISRQVRR